MKIELQLALLVEGKHIGETIKTDIILVENILCIGILCLIVDHNVYDVTYL